MSRIKSISLWTVWVIFAIVLFSRISQDRYVSVAKADIPEGADERGVSGILTWDVFGYYLYLPAYFIYDDIDDLEFAPELIDQYRSTETFYQADRMENGNMVMKYTMGLSIMYSPFFLAAHGYASATDHYPDGLSTPYQLSIALSAVFYFLLGMILLRKILLRYYNETVTTIVLVIIALGTNLYQFTAFDGAMPHSYLFALYTLILWYTIKWHEEQKWHRAFLLGLFIGLAALIRPTEIIALIIPSLWGVSNWQDLKGKFALLWKYKFHVILLGFGVFLAGLPQLLYWKSVSGEFLYYTYGEEGFVFSRPQLANVLFSFRKGWLIYTPLMIFAILGFVFLYKQKRELFWVTLAFFLINTYIISSWSNWWYAGSFGHRAFIQTYCVMAIPLGAFLAWLLKRGMTVKLASLSFLGLLWCYNLFQHYQYANWLIDPSRMTAEYYWNIFLKTDGSGVDRGLLTTEEFYNPWEEYIHEPSNFDVRVFGVEDFESAETQSSVEWAIDKEIKYSGEASYRMDADNLYSPGFDLEVPELNYTRGTWVRATAQVYPTVPYTENPAALIVSFESMGKVYKYKGMGIDSAKVIPNQWNEVVLECIIPEIRYNDDKLKIFMFNQGTHQLYVDDVKLELYEPKPKK